MRTAPWLFLSILSLTLVPAAPALAQTQEQEAGDVSEIDKDDVGPLKNRIPPVSGHYFLRRSRFEVTPQLGLSFVDAFFSKDILGGALTYHPSETIGIMLHGGYSLVRVSGAAQKCVSSLTNPALGLVCTEPTYDDENGKAPGNIMATAGLDLQWAPIYGKISLVSELVAHIDIYGVLGPVAVLYGAPPTGTTTAGSAPPGSVPTWTVGGEAGVGMHVFLNRWFTLRVELRDMFYVENVNLLGPTLRQQPLFNVGLSFFFPTNFEEN